MPSQELEITVNTAPSPTVTGAGFVCDNEPAEYSTSGNSGSTYSWEVTGGEIISGAGTSQVSVMWGNPGPGTLQVSEVNEAGCEATSALLMITIDDCTGTGEDGISGIKIYPNPFAENLHFTGLQDATIRIYNLMGEEVMAFTHVYGQQIVNTSVLNKSIYLVKVEQAGNMSVKQLVKQ
jgi:hypothetical protein